MNENEYKTFIDQCLARWSSQDKRTDDFKENFITWIAQLPDESKPLVLKLLENFDYYTHTETNRILRQLHQKLIDEYLISDENTIYTFIRSKTGEGNSSIDYWIDYKFINNLNKHICFADTTFITNKQWEMIDNIILVDDCSGTGKTLTDYVRENALVYKNKRIFYIIIHAMEESLEKIAQCAAELDVSIVPLYSIARCKAFINPVLGDDLIVIKTSFVDLSQSLGIPQPHILGYEESEGLMAFHNNTPNNTLGLFRWVDKRYKAIFPRTNDPRPEWQRKETLDKLINDRKRRRAQNYNAQKGI